MCGGGLLDLGKERHGHGLVVHKAVARAFVWAKFSVRVKSMDCSIPAYRFADTRYLIFRPILKYKPTAHAAYQQRKLRCCIKKHGCRVISRVARAAYQVLFVRMH